MTGRGHDDLVRRQFGASAQSYRTSASHARGYSLTRLLALTGPRPDWRVLDVATGAGHTAAALAPHVQLVAAGDMTPEMLQQAAIVAREHGLTNVHLVRENAGALAYRNGAFDLAACRVAAHHFPDPGRVVAECARVLKTEGRLAVIDNVVPDDAAIAGWINDFERRRDPSHVRCLSVAQWQALFDDHGLRLEHVEVNEKWFDFEEWMGRMNAAPETIELMGGELLDAPPGVRDFWHPRGKPGRIEFALNEAILIGRLRP